MYDLLQAGQADKAKRLLPPERAYPVSAELGRRLLIETATGKIESDSALDRGPKAGRRR